LLAEGLSSATSIKTGSPMLEVLTHYMSKVEKSTILESLKLESKKYFVVSAHREENIANEIHFLSLCKIMNEIAEQYKYPIIVTTHPRTRKMIEKFGIEFNSLIRLEKPFALSDYIMLQINAKAVLSDSGTISEESSILSFPALNIREAQERHEAVEEATVMMTGLNPERVIQALAQLETEDLTNRKFRLVNDYNIPNVSDKVVRIILSYTDYIKRTVWQENILP
jgi:UDP-N-acetylglucosamine 2-epimerase (non-hydrolysing)